jgi:hypothetical protein
MAHATPYPRLDQTLAAMRAGETLQLQLGSGGPLWALSDGSAIPADVAAHILSHGVEPTSHRLAPGMPARVWRLTS